MGNAWGKFIIESYLFIFCLSLLVGFLFPDFLKIFAPYGAVILGIIFFLSSLSLQTRVLFRYFSRFSTLIVVNIFMLIALPLVLYFLLQYTFPQFALAALLLGAMPSGMTSPFLTSIIGGKPDLAVVLSLSNSLLAPFTIPLVIFLAVGREVEVSFLAMLWSLCKVLIFPFLLARIVKKVAHKKSIRYITTAQKPFSLLLLGLLIASVVAANRSLLLESLRSIDSIYAFFFLIFFFLFTFVLGYYLTPWLTKVERVTVSNCVTYLSFILAIVIAGKFFPTKEVLTPIVLSMLVWGVSIIPWKWFVERYILVSVVKN